MEQARNHFEGGPVGDPVGDLMEDSGGKLRRKRSTERNNLALAHLQTEVGHNGSLGHHPENSSPRGRRV
eukprot:8137813-Pyramimonas_sp.AAC.1